MNKLEPSKAGKLFPKLFGGGEFIMDDEMIDASTNTNDEVTKIRTTRYSFIVIER